MEKYFTGSWHTNGKHFLRRVFVKPGPDHVVDGLYFEIDPQ
jgi:hypothetical protein